MSIFANIILTSLTILINTIQSDIECEVFGSTMRCGLGANGNLKTIHNDQITELQFADCNLRFLDPIWLKQFPQLKKVHLNGNQIDCNCYARRKILAFLKSNIMLIGHCGFPKMIEGIPLNNLTECEENQVNNTIINGEDLRHRRNIIYQKENKVVNVMLNSRATLNCTCFVTNCNNYIWIKNRNQQIQQTRRIFFHHNQLIINNLQFQDSGLYICVDADNHSKIYNEVQLNIFGKPTVYFDRKTYFPYERSDLELKCNVNGNPAPTIQWFKNGHRLSSDNYSYFVITNDKLILRSISSNIHSGQYRCSALNSFGISSTLSEVQVKEIVRPIITSKANTDILSDVKSKVIMCCSYSSEPPATVRWFKNNKELTFDDRFTINRQKCLIISNTSTTDSGTYECVVSNIGGKAKCISSLSVIDPNSRQFTIEFLQTKWSEALTLDNNATLGTLTQMLKFVNFTTLDDLFNWLRYDQNQMKDLRKAEKIIYTIISVVQEKLKEIDNNKRYPIQTAYQMRPDNYHNSPLSARHLHILSALTGCFPHQQIPIDCNSKCLYYRSADATCNNLDNVMWGSSQTPFINWLNQEYENKFNLPKGWNESKLYNGFQLPSARSISNLVISTSKIEPDPDYTQMLMQWGQFVDHDLTHTLMATGTHIFSDARLCTSSCTKDAPCFPIRIPANDPRRIHRGNCIEFIRSTDVCLTGETSFVNDHLIERQQINQITSYLDASNVYGSTEQELHDLREHSFGKGLLKMRSDNRFSKRMLPFAVDTPVDCQRDRDVIARPVGCFLTGDHRASEQLGLTAMHTIWARQHNRIALALTSVNPTWSSEKVFQEARKIVYAQQQHITIQHWLPYIIGGNIPEYKGYDKKINAQMANVFATAAFRFGHSLITPVIYRLNESLQPIKEGNLLLRDAFFSPWRILEEGGIDPLLRGLFTMPAKIKVTGQILNKELTEQLFHLVREISQDLAALNIQRGRDHGLPSYTAWRSFCNLSVPKNFVQLTKAGISNTDVIRDLARLYGSVENIDVWVGGILEDVLENAKVGPLFKCIISRQFQNLRDGDRFWYESKDQFTANQLNEIKKTTLANIICQNSDNIKEIPENVFLIGLPLKECNSLPDLSIEAWRGCCDDIRRIKICNEPSIHNYNPIPPPRSYGR